MFGEAVLAYVIGLSVHRLAVILTGALGQKLAGRRSDLFTGIVSGFGRKGVATREGWLCVRLAWLAIGVVRLSC